MLAHDAQAFQEVRQVEYETDYELSLPSHALPGGQALWLEFSYAHLIVHHIVTYTFDGFP